MRDGVQLAMDVVRPTEPGRYPVILIRTPYNKVACLGSPRGKALQDLLARSGYIIAVQDCRGRFNSDGVFDPYRQEHADGYDTIEWLASQDWCDGNVGMIGASYCGGTQWCAAADAPKALKAIVPIASQPGNPFVNEPLCGGVMLMCEAEWMAAMGRRCEHVIGLNGIYTQEPDYFEAMPLSRVALIAGTTSRWWDEWLSHPTYDAYWQSHGYEKYWGQISVPALNVTGWWDMNFLGAPRNFVGMGAHGATTEARDGQRLVIGPWAHYVNQTRSLSGVDFGPDSVTALDAYTRRFFDYWLRGERDNGLASEGRVHVFVLGANQWWESNAWPLPGTQLTEFYLDSEGHANSHRGDGKLSRSLPTSTAYDEYYSDPLDPVRAVWRIDEGPVDDRPQSARQDVLCYTSEVLEGPLDIVGPVSAVLYASSSARDCDWHLRLVDVDPNGVARFLCHGALRARFRNGFEIAEFLEPGRIECYAIDMTAVGIRFLPGHRIRVEIASSWFSRFERNPQTDAVNWMTEKLTPVVARQRIHHSLAHASRLVLPLIPAQ